MSIITFNTEIKEKDKIDNILTDEFKFNCECNFAKLILDFIIEGNIIRIKKYKCVETTIDNKEYYQCIATIVIKKTIDDKDKLSNKGCNFLGLELNNNKLEKIKIKFKDFNAEKKKLKIKGVDINV